MTRKSIIEDSLGANFNRETEAFFHVLIAFDLDEERKCVIRAPKAPSALFAQDLGHRGAVAVRDRSTGAVIYTGTFGLFLSQQDRLNGRNTTFYI